MSGSSAHFNLLLQLHIGRSREVQLLRQLCNLRFQSALRGPAALTPLQGNQSIAGALASAVQEHCSALLVGLCNCCDVVCKRSGQCRVWQGLTREWREAEP